MSHGHMSSPGEISYTLKYSSLDSLVQRFEQSGLKRFDLIEKFSRALNLKRDIWPNNQLSVLVPELGGTIGFIFEDEEPDDRCVLACLIILPATLPDNPPGGMRAFVFAHDRWMDHEASCLHFLDRVLAAQQEYFQERYGVPVTIEKCFLHNKVELEWNWDQNGFSKEFDGGQVIVRSAASREEAIEAMHAQHRIWKYEKPIEDEPRIYSPWLYSSNLGTMRDSEGVALIAFKGTEVLGFVIGFRALGLHLPRVRAELYSRSQILGADTKFVGTGTKLKASQRDKVHAASPGIDYMTWTFDPFLRNREFNLGLGAFIGGGEEAWELATYEGRIPGTGADRLLAVLPLNAPRVDRFMKQALHGKREQVPVEWILHEEGDLKAPEHIHIQLVNMTRWQTDAQGKSYLDLVSTNLEGEENIVAIEMPLEWREMFPDTSVPAAQHWLAKMPELFRAYFKREYFVTHFSRDLDMKRTFLVLQRVALRRILEVQDDLSRALAQE